MREGAHLDDDDDDPDQPARDSIANDEDHKHYRDEDDDSWSSSDEAPSDSNAGSERNPKISSNPLSLIRGIKKQARYEPEVPMAKADLVVWRKEARRVRNRESAAASRNKTRVRIDELEQQLASMEAWNRSLLQRIQELEQQSKASVPETQPKSASFMSAPLSTAPVVIKEKDVSHRVSPLLSPTPPLQSDDDSFHWQLSHQQAAEALANSLHPQDCTCKEVHVSIAIDSRTTTLNPQQPTPDPQRFPFHQNLTISRPIAI